MEPNPGRKRFHTPLARNETEVEAASSVVFALPLPVIEKVNGFNVYFLWTYLDQRRSY